MQQGFHPTEETNWYVITGGPGCGKTTTVNLLKERGYATTIEHARHYIDTMRIKGKSVEEIRKNQRVFQLNILKMQIAEENSQSHDAIIFFDRAVPDALAYYRYFNMPVDQLLWEALRSHRYKKIFILDALPIVNDYARTEDEAAQQKLHDLITEVYEAMRFPVLHVPVMPPSDRVDWILRHL